MVGRGLRSREMSHPVFVPAPLGRRRPPAESGWKEKLAALRYVQHSFG